MKFSAYEKAFESSLAAGPWVVEAENSTEAHRKICVTRARVRELLGFLDRLVEGGAFCPANEHDIWRFNESVKYIADVAQTPWNHAPWSQSHSCLPSGELVQPPAESVSANLRLDAQTPQRAMRVYALETKEPLEQRLDGGLDGGGLVLYATREIAEIACKHYAEQFPEDAPVVVELDVDTWLPDLPAAASVPATPAETTEAVPAQVPEALSTLEPLTFSEQRIFEKAKALYSAAPPASEIRAQYHCSTASAKRIHNTLLLCDWAEILESRKPKPAEILL